MSTPGHEERVEPNLVPLLDLILQLVMFFMVCVNFVTEQVNAKVKLPSSSSAQEIMAKTEVSVLVINIEIVRQDRRGDDGRVLRDRKGQPMREIVKDGQGRKTTRITFAGLEDISFKEGEEAVGAMKAQRRLADLARLQRTRLARESGRPQTEIKDLKTPVVIRADLETNFGIVYPLVAQCNKEGFPRVGLRAETKR